MTFINNRTPITYRSSYNPLVGFSDEVIGKVNSFIENRVKKFIRLMSINPDDVVFLESNDIITDKEFQNTSTELSNSYFYEVLFTDIAKDHDGRINEKLKICITFDKDLTLDLVDDISFGFIRISERPILYYIFFDFQELIKISKFG